MMQMAPDNVTLHLALAAVAMEARLSKQDENREKKKDEVTSEAQRRKEEADAQRAHELATSLAQRAHELAMQERTDTLVRNNQELAVLVFMFHV